MKLTSTAFEEGQSIPRKHTGVGADVSPPLQWDDIPSGTRQFVLTCVDENAPGPDPWVHWVMYEIPASVFSISEHVPNDRYLPELGAAMQGCNSFSIGSMHGYKGPMPHAETGVHHYVFTIYALENELDLEAGLHLRTVLSAMDGHIIESATLTGTFER